MLFQVAAVWVSELVGYIVSAFTTLMSGLGSGIVTFMSNIMLDSEGNLTVLAISSFVLLGIGFAFAMVKVILSFVRKK